MRVILLAAALGLTAPMAGAATVANGGFEDTTFAGGFQTTSSLNGWTVESGTVDLINTYWASSEGTHNVDMSGNAPAVISQVISGLTVGDSYFLTFDLSGNPDGPPVVKSLLAAIGGTSGLFTFDSSTAVRPSAMNWTPMVLRFTAEASSLTLRFSSVNDTVGFYGAALDNVAISAVPLPAAAPLLLAGLGGLVALGRRRRG